MTHPLTRKICHEIVDGKNPSKYRFQYTNFFIEDYMRAGADWQLIQVIEWLKDNLHLMPTSVNYIVENLREAMRPTTQEDN